MVACSESPCQNNAVCLFEDDQPVCYCVPDYHGTFCELRYDDCESRNVRCENGGTCVDGVNNFTCSCPPPFGGELCTMVMETTTEQEEYETTLDELVDYTSVLPGETSSPPAPPAGTTELVAGVVVEDYSTTLLSSGYSIALSTEYSTDEEPPEPAYPDTTLLEEEQTSPEVPYEYTSTEWLAPDRTTGPGRAIDADYDETIVNNSLTATSPQRVVTMLPTTISSGSGGGGGSDLLTTDSLLPVETTSNPSGQEDFITVTEFHKTTFGTEFDKSEVTAVVPPTSQFHACTKDQCANLSLCLHNSTQVCQNCNFFSTLQLFYSASDQIRLYLLRSVGL